MDLSADDIESDVGVVGSKTSDVVTVTASASSAERAALLANTYAETARRLAIDDERAEARLALGSLKSQFDKLPVKVQQHVSGPGAQLRHNIQKMQVIADIGNGSPQIIQPGYVPSSKAGNPLQTVILGLLFGVVLGVGLALLREQGDRRLHGVEEASVAFDAPVLSTVPRHRALKRHVPFADLPPEVAEAFRHAADELALWPRGAGAQRPDHFLADAGRQDHHRLEPRLRRRVGRTRRRARGGGHAATRARGALRPPARARSHRGGGGQDRAQRCAAVA